MSEEIKVTLGSGNVFADLGLPDAEELLDKSKVLCAITRALEGRGIFKAKEQAQFLEMPLDRWQKMRRGRLLGQVPMAEYQALQVKAMRGLSWDLPDVSGKSGQVLAEVEGKWAWRDKTAQEEQESPSPEPNDLEPMWGGGVFEKF